MIILLCMSIVSLLINFILVHIDSKKRGYLNPVGAIMSIFPFFGTLLLLIVFIVDYLDGYYRKY